MPLFFSLFMIQACGVAIHSDSHHQPHSDFVSYKIYELTPRGDLDYIYSDCINLDDPFEDEGSVHVDTPYAGEDLILSWYQVAGDISLTFEDNFHLIHRATFDTYVFRFGEVQEFIIGTGQTDYFISLEGPHCVL